MTPRSLTPGFSLSLDLIRFWAALVVLFSHFAVQRVSGGLFWQFNIIPFGHHAVVFFFVLSGLLMAYVVQGRENTALKYYSARIIRMSTVVVPMLILVPLLDLVGSNFSEKNYEGIFNNPLDAGKQILLGVTYLHESWWQSTRYFSNTPYWSIAYEVWYYIAFGTLVFLKGIRRWIAFFYDGFGCRSQNIPFIPGLDDGGRRMAHHANTDTKVAGHASVYRQSDHLHTLVHFRLPRAV